MNPSTRRLIIGVLCLFALPLLDAELMVSDLGFYIDPPEGYVLAGQVSDGRFSFSGPLGGQTLAIVSSPPAKGASTAQMARDLRSRGVNFSGTEFIFQGRQASIGKARLVAGGQPMEGYALLVAGRDGERSIQALSVADARMATALDASLASALDSLSLDEAGLRQSGPLSWSRSAPDAPSDSTAKLEWNGMALPVEIRKADAQAAQAVVEREAAVLALYGDSPLWKEAWARFFRMVYRDSYRRLDQAAFLMGLQIERLWREEGRIVGTLSDKAAAAGKAATGKKDGPPVPSEAYVSAVLDFVNGFRYERDPSGADFVNPLQAVLERRGDCDARALAAAILLHHMNQDASLMVSSTYSHAMALVDLPGEKGRNAGIEVGGKRYLAAETTRREAPGMIDPAMAVADEWIGVPLLF